MWSWTPTTAVSSTGGVPHNALGCSQRQAELEGPRGGFQPGPAKPPQAEAAEPQSIWPGHLAGSRAGGHTKNPAWRELVPASGAGCYRVLRALRVYQCKHHMSALARQSRFTWKLGWVFFSNFQMVTTHGLVAPARCLGWSSLPKLKGKLLTRLEESCSYIEDKFYSFFSEGFTPFSFQFFPMATLWLSLC